MRKELSPDMVRWLGMGGRVFSVWDQKPVSMYAHKIGEEPPRQAQQVGYLRAYNRSGAVRMLNNRVRVTGASLFLGSQMRQRDIVAALAAGLPEIDASGAAFVFRGGSPAPRRNPQFDGGRRQVLVLVHWIDPETTIPACGSRRGPATHDFSQATCPKCRAFVLNGTHDNPPLVVFGNPPGKKSRGSKLLSRRAISIRYVHAADRQRYEHKFGSHDCIELLPDGSVRIYNSQGKKLFGEF